MVWEVYWFPAYGEAELIDSDIDYDRLAKKYHGKMFEIREAE